MSQSQWQLRRGNGNPGVSRYLFMTFSSILHLSLAAGVTYLEFLVTGHGDAVVYCCAFRERTGDQLRLYRGGSRIRPESGTGFEETWFRVPRILRNLQCHTGPFSRQPVCGQIIPKLDIANVVAYRLRFERLENAYLRKLSASLPVLFVG